MTRSKAQREADKRYDAKRKGKRKRNWSTVVYPESAPTDWLAKLANSMVQALVSPLHDKDNDDDGARKKPHYHVLLMFDNPQLKEAAKDIFSEIGGVGCDPIRYSLRGSVRYLCHLDSPDKARYSEEDVKCLSGADYFSLAILPTDKYEFIDEMTKWVDEFNVVSYAELYRYARDNQPEWRRCLCDSGSYVMKEYIKSAHWSRQSRSNP